MTIPASRGETAPEATVRTSTTEHGPLSGEAEMLYPVGDDPIQTQSFELPTQGGES